MTLSNLSLFSGIGGFELGMQLSSGTFNTTQFVEIDAYNQAVLRHHFPSVPIHDDIRTFTPSKGAFDLFTIGFPCTGTSNAGKRNGLKHEESNLWYEALRCINEGKPYFVIIENPVGLIQNGLREVLGGLRMAAYSFDMPTIISAKEFGLPHQRKRMFIVAYANDIRSWFRDDPTEWSDQIGTSIKEVLSAREQIVTRGYSMDDGLPAWLDGISLNHRLYGHPQELTMPLRIKYRRECVSSYGRAVCPLQAAVALNRVHYLADLMF